MEEMRVGNAGMRQSRGEVKRYIREYESRKTEKIKITAARKLEEKMEIRRNK